MDISLINCKPLKIINLKAGDLLHVLKESDDDFCGFGEAYFTKVNLDSIKGWKKHYKMTLNLVVPIGNVEFVFYDDNGCFKSIKIGEDNYQRITAPPNLWFAFRGLSSPFSLIVPSTTSPAFGSNFRAE